MFQSSASSNVLRSWSSRLGFNNCLKIADVPFPLPFAQLLGLLLVAFSLLIPLPLVPAMFCSAKGPPEANWHWNDALLSSGFSQPHDGHRLKRPRIAQGRLGMNMNSFFNQKIQQPPHWLQRSTQGMSSSSPSHGWWGRFSAFCSLKAFGASTRWQRSWRTLLAKTATTLGKQCRCN